jgi:prepilin peptidase CpaA
MSFDTTHGPALLSAGALIALLLAATVIDVRARRIPNALVASGTLIALAVHAIAPAGDGLFASPWGSIGVVQSLLGVCAGLTLFLPLYLLRALGAGDVKLLAMVGAWLGAPLLGGATVLILLAGGAMALFVMVFSRTSRQVLGNVRFMLTTAVIGAQSGRLAPLEAPVASSARLPYALAILAGTAAQLVWQLAQAGP